MVYLTLVRSNIPQCGIFDHGKVQYSGIWYIQPCKVHYTGIWYIRYNHGRLYQFMVYLADYAGSNIPFYGIIDLANGRIHLVMVYLTLPITVEYASLWYDRPG